MTLLLIRNANLYAPRPLGIRHLLIGGGRILWIGDEALDLPVPLRTVSQRRRCGRTHARFRDSSTGTST